MSTRYSTYFPAQYTERAIEPNKPTRREPAHQGLRRKDLFCVSSVGGSMPGRSRAAIRRPLNDHPAPSGAGLQPENARVTARDLMKACSVTLRPEDSIERAARFMRETESGSVPVVDGIGRLIGIISERDIAVKLVALGASIPHAQVSDCMIGEAFACSVDSTLESCVSAMSWHQLKSIPVVDDEHKILGTISRSDLACYLCDNPQRTEPDAMTDILWALAS
ncbi:MAG TPA: CBS domain-containing protein [Blastocatellia bacterium]|nr:CBS domain-containing protein [Blastocatellia bacterium]